MDLKRLENKLDIVLLNLGIEDLMDYTLDDFTGRDITEFYKITIDFVLGVDSRISGDEISDGKYRLYIHIGEEEYYLYSKSSYGPNEIKSILIADVIQPFLVRRKYFYGVDSEEI